MALTKNINKLFHQLNERATYLRSCFYRSRGFCFIMATVLCGNLRRPRYRSRQIDICRKGGRPSIIHF